MSTATIIPLFGRNTPTKQQIVSTDNRAIAEDIAKAGKIIAADTEPIHSAWVTIVRPGGLVEQIDLR